MLKHKSKPRHYVTKKSQNLATPERLPSDEAVRELAK